jgi:hypothetical protein
MGVLEPDQKDKRKEWNWATFTGLVMEATAELSKRDMLFTHRKKV